MTPSFPRLLADIGGTNARFGLQTGKNTGIEYVRSYPVQMYDGPAKAAQSYLSGLPENTPMPQQAAFAVATAVTGDQVTLTNSHWRFSRSAVEAELGLETFLILNDFEALALALPHLQASQLRAHGKLPKPEGVLAVIGPGTGLGVAGMVQTCTGWIALPSEGGHATLPPSDEFESMLLAQVRQTYPHVSAERLLSGTGLPILHNAVNDSANNLSAESIIERGLQNDPVCARTLDTFCALLGNFAGNVALILGARGGVYIGGGIVPRLGDYFFKSRFRECFESKGRFRSYLQDIPTVLITDTLAALTGAAAAIEQS